MKIAELIRLEESHQGTIGVLRINKEVFCMTLEPPDELNVSNISHIPAQQYLCNPYTSPKYKETYIVDGVPGRDYILFHAGNTASHTHGCILLGSTTGKLRGERAVLNSGKTFERFMEKMGGKRFHLTITTNY